MNKLSYRIANIVALLLCIFLGSSCRDNGSTSSRLDSGSNEFRWTIDTLSYPGSSQTFMRDIWGSSSRDIYVVGNNDQGGRGTMYHYNGSNWSDVKLASVQGGSISGAFSLFSVYGFNSTDVYAVGDQIAFDQASQEFLDSTLIIHFNGVSWNEIQVPRREWASCIRGSGTTDAWVGGSAGTLYHLNGNSYNEFSVGHEFFITSIACLSQDDVFAEGNRTDWTLPVDSSAYVLFHFDGTSWKRVDSAMRTSGSPPSSFGAAIWTDKVHLYSLAPNISQLENNVWTIIFEGPVGHMFKNADNDIYAVGESIFHYDGNTWLRFTKFDTIGSVWEGGYSNGREVFVLGSNGKISIVLHGR